MIEPMDEFLTTREVAELLRIKERKVYDLAASGQLPCNKSMGKLLFPKSEIAAWLATGQSHTAPAIVARGRPNVFLGSHDPLLEWALRESHSGLAAYFDGSDDGLNRFAASEGIATGLHLFDPSNSQWNIAQVSTRFGNLAVVLVEWAKRQRGLIVSGEKASQIRGLTDIVDLRFAARQPGAGAQHVFEHLCQKAGIRPDQFEVAATLRTETEAALAVLEGKADFSFGLQSLAVQYQLAFVPVVEERYDLLVDRRAWFEPGIQALMRFCVTDTFKARADEMAGYDISSRGRVHFNGP